MPVAAWAKEFTEEVFGVSPFEIGQTVLHPDGRHVRIMSGQYWGEHGISNFWSWREVLPDGSLSPKEENGNGFKPAGKPEPTPMTAGELADYFAALPRDLPVYRQDERGGITKVDHVNAPAPIVLKVQTLHMMPPGRYPSQDRIFRSDQMPPTLPCPIFDAVIL